MFVRAEITSSEIKGTTVIAFLQEVLQQDDYRAFKPWSH